EVKTRGEEDEEVAGEGVVKMVGEWGEVEGEKGLLEEELEGVGKREGWLVLGMAVGLVVLW
uniref:hypothetical protein n=1 Tax=Kocuria rhizophila TaxID=72000 RepID=UPI00164299AB